MKSLGLNPKSLLLTTLLLATPLASKAAWQVHVDHSNQGVNTSVSSISGGMNLNLSCRADGIYIVLHDYPGNAISRVDDDSMQIRIVFINADGSTLRAFTVPFHYFAPDTAHVMSETGRTPMADAWGAVSTMVFQSVSGEEVARFDLTGTFQARKRFRQVCGV